MLCCYSKISTFKLHLIQIKWKFLHIICSSSGTYVEMKLVHACMLSHVRLFATLWTVAHQPPLSMGFSRQEYWSGLPCPPPGHIPHPGIKFTSPAMQVDSLPLSHLASPPNRKYVWTIASFNDLDGEGNGNPLQYSCLENPMDRGGWWATVHGIKESLTWLSD